jgi:hypothetical protein
MRPIQTSPLIQGKLGKMRWGNTFHSSRTSCPAMMVRLGLADEAQARVEEQP